MWKASVIVWLLVADAALAASVQGHVASEGAPVADAEVYGEVGGTRRAATTDADGHFVLDLPEGVGTLEVMSFEHEPYTAELTVVAGMEPVEVALLPGDFNEVVVLYFDDPDPVVTKRSVTNAEVQRVPGAFGDPVRVVTSLPGAARPPFGSSQLIIRGGNEDDTSVFLDGVEIPIVYHLGGYRSVVHPSMVAEVDFLPGVFPARYGDTTSGVVDIQTRADWSDQWETKVQADLLDASASARGTLFSEGVGVAAAVRRSYIDAVLAPLSDDFILPWWSDYQVQMQTLKTGRHTFRLVALGLTDRLGSEDSDFGITTSTVSHRVVGTWLVEPTDNFELFVQPSVGWDDERVGLGSTIEVQEKGTRLGVRAEGKWTPNNAWVVTAGAQVQASNLTIDAQLPFDPSDSDAGSGFSTSDARWMTQPDPYAEVQLRPFFERDRLLLSAGVRAETMLRQGLEAETGLSPRGSARLKLWEGAVLKGGLARSHQSPDATALAFSPDTQLRLERSTIVEGGVEQTVEDVLTVDVVGYAKWMDRIATQQFRRPSFTNDGIGRSYGLEVLVRKEPVGPLFGWVSYSLGRSERIDDPETSDEWVLYGFDQTHNLIAVGGYELGKGWDFSSRFQYTTGNPFTPYEGAVYDLSDGSYIGIPSGDENSDRIPDYLALDVRVSKTWRWRNGSLKAYVDVLNLVQGQNPELVLDAYDYTERAYVTGLPLLPSPGVEAQWRF